MRQILTIALLLMAMTSSAGDGVADDRWVGTWAAAPQIARGVDMPQDNDLSYSSLREVVRVSVGGRTLRLRLSNEYSAEPVEIRSVYIATAGDSCQIDRRSARYLSFGKRRAVTLQAGEAIESDAVKFQLRPLQRLTVTINYGKTPKEATAHLGSRTTSYILKRESTPKSDFTRAQRVDHWYNIAAIDVMTDGKATGEETGSECLGAIAVLGNSITDGRGSTTNLQNRWTDILATSLHEAGSRLSVLNLGIGGNSVVRGGLATPGIQRYDRDILQQEGVTTVVIFEGVNDIGGANGNSEQVARELTEAYRQLIDKAHAKGLKVYGGTITPFGGHSYYSFFHEAARQTVNEWIRHSGAFDGVIDFDALLRDPAHPDRLKAEYQSDWLHPNPAGYEQMGIYAAKVLLNEK